MRIKLEDIIGFPTAEAHYLKDHLIRFQLEEPRECSSDQQCNYADHFCCPAYLYTNGQALVSLVLCDEDRFEVVHHRSISAFEQFGHPLSQLVLVDSKDVRIVDSFAGAEEVAQKWLSDVKTWSLSMRKGSERETIVLQSAGSRAGWHGYAGQTVIASFRGEQFRLRIGLGWGLEYEPYRVLNDLRPHYAPG